MDETGVSAAQERLALSSLLVAVAEGGAGRISVAEILERFGRRAFGAALFVCSLLNLLPAPPGSSTVLGMPLLIIAPQLAFGAKAPWLPGFIASRTVERGAFGRACLQAAQWVRRVERLTRPRLGFMFNAPGEMLIGTVCALLAAVLVLPIPLGNLLPAASVAILALSLVQRDGALAVIGYLLAAAAVGLVVLSGRVVLFAVERLAAMLGL